MRGEHTNNGLFVAAGPPIRRGVRADRAIRLSDVCPTLLYLLGLPVAADMHGRPFTPLLTEEYQRANPVEQIASYGARSGAADAPSRSQFDEEIIERLRTLGYLN